jgi:hypothetical protein
MWFTKREEPRVILGTTGPWYHRQDVDLHGHDISQHAHIIGLTGQGKSKLLASMYVQLLRHGRPAALLDPHADLADDVLGMLNDDGFFSNPQFANKFLYIDFSRQDRYLPFNILNTRYRPHETARHVVEVCKRVWPALANGAAPLFENVMLASTLTLIENNLSITEAPRLITDRSYRDMLLSQVSDQQVVHFFKASFDNLRPVDQLDQAQSSLRRLFLLTFSETLRYSLGQPDNALDFRQLMDEGISVVFNLGGLDADTQRFLGCLITVGYENAALSRADTFPWKRTPYHLSMDEFSMFSPTSENGLARILSLTRKYNLSLGMAHQTFSQISERIRGALGNTMRIAFRLQPDDAAWMAQQIGEYDPFEIKHVVSDEGVQDRSHPVFYTVQESYERLRTMLKSLSERHAVVKTGHGYREIETLRVPPAKTPQRELTALKESFAQRLLTSRQRAIEIVDGHPAALETNPPNI